MLFVEHPVLVRGGGDLATGAIVALSKAGFPVSVLELSRPLAIRRRVAFASAVMDGEVQVDGVSGRLVESVSEADGVARSGTVAVVVEPDLPQGTADIVVDARMAKRLLDTSIDDASLVVALGPGPIAGVDCHAVVETQRGHRLGRVIWDGAAAADTGTPGRVGGVAGDRVVRAPVDGPIEWSVEIGDTVVADQQLGVAGQTPITTGIGGVVRGLISPGFEATAGLKIADIDPRGDGSAAFEVSDKARLVGAGVLEAVLVWLNR